MVSKKISFAKAKPDDLDAVCFNEIFFFTEKCEIKFAFSYAVGIFHTRSVFHLPQANFIEKNPISPIIKPFSGIFH